MRVEYTNKVFLHADTLCVCVHIVTNLWNSTKKEKKFYVPEF